MRKKRMWRYYCDHCKKAGCSAGHMAAHERHCCGNPERVCRMCAVDKGEPNEQKPMAELTAIYEKDGVKGVRAAANGCPACILAAIIIWRKQNGDIDKSHPDYWEDNFDFKEERLRWFTEKNSGEGPF